MENLLDEVLKGYKGKVVENTSTKWEESDYELNEYLNGSGDVIHLYNYYDLKDEEVFKDTVQMSIEEKVNFVNKHKDKGLPF